jgi:hypothetical protein
MNARHFHHRAEASRWTGVPKPSSGGARRGSSGDSPSPLAGGSGHLDDTAPQLLAHGA